MEMSKSLHPLQKCVSAATLPSFSPLTDLSLDLGELTTGGETTGTPRRRISWSNLSENEASSDNDSPFLKVRPFKEDPPTPPGKVFNIKSRGLALRRLKSMPTNLFSPFNDRFAPMQTLQESDASPKKRSSCDTISDIDDSLSCDSGIYGEKEDGKSETSTLSGKSSSSRSIGSFFIKSSSTSSSSSEFPDFSSDDGFLDVFDMDVDEETQLPSGVSQLLKGRLQSNEIVSTHSDSLPVIKESPDSASSKVLGEKDTNIVDTPKRNCTPGLFRSPSDPSSNSSANKSQLEHSSTNLSIFKRPEPPRENKSPIKLKRYRSCCHNQENCQSCNQTATLQKRSHSETEATIMRALQKSTNEPDLIGDFSKPFSLPLVTGKHQDLKSISSDTLTRVMRGDFKDDFSSFQIVDCRYPYEYEGGHIEGAANYYTHQQIEEKLLATGSESNEILIFHCEFSSERAPKLLRYLRKKDREGHQETYPSLDYPEVYLLDGGYKAFFELHKEDCYPQQYKPMNHKDHQSDLRNFRAKSKSWSADYKGRHISRPGLKF